MGLCLYMSPISTVKNEIFIKKNLNAPLEVDQGSLVFTRTVHYPLKIQSYTDFESSMFATQICSNSNKSQKVFYFRNF